MGKSLSGKELGRGISQNKDGIYIGRFTSKTGKRKSVSGRNLADVKKRLREAETTDERNVNPIYGDITLDEWFEIWKTVCKVHCRETTIRSYGAAYKRIQKSLGGVKLTSLNMIIIQRAFNALKTDGSREKTKDVLVDILNCAVDADIIAKNPALKIKTTITNDERREQRALSDAEIEIVLQTSKEMKSRLYPIFVVGFNTGMRIGEILGLTWDKIDFKDNIIHVEKSLAYIYSSNKGESRFVFNPPKTKAGVRDIPMTKDVKVALLEQKMRCNRIYSMHEPLTGFENLVFPGTQNHPIDASCMTESIRSVLKRIEKNGGHVDPFTPHSMRHTFATKCIARGMKPKVLQKILGHKSMRMTMEIYCHVEEETVKDEMALFAVLA